MKTPEAICSDLNRKLAQHWQTWLTRDAATPWPMTVALGRPDSADLRSGFATANRWAIQWREFAAARNLTLAWTNRSVHGSTQSLPTHLTVPDLTTAAALAGSGWPTRLRRAQERWDVLQQRFPATATPGHLRYADALNDVEFEVLCTSGAWFATHDATGLTPRQVPVEGVHGKWLNQHRATLQALAGKADLGLIERPSRVLFTYLDPDHGAAGRRRHDSYTLGDTAEPEYEPGIVIICENKDTAQLFPEVPRGIAVFGNGYAGVRHLPQVPWLSKVETIKYWGDIDSAGFEILDGLRTAGLPVESLLMDMQTYESYERYGSTTDRHGEPLTPSAPKPLATLTAQERALYERLCAEDWTRVRRIEQERIPLAVTQRRLLA